MQSCVRTILAGKKGLDVCFLADPDRPSPPYQKHFIDKSNYRSFLAEWLPVFYLNPMLTTLRVYEDRTDYEVHGILKELILNAGSLNLPDYLTELSESADADLGSYALVNDFHSRFGYIPRPVVPERYREQIRARLKPAFPSKSVFVAVHLRPRAQEDGTWRPDGPERDRDARIDIWAEFFSWAEREHPEVMFVAVGRAIEWSEALCDRSNLVLLRSLGYGLMEELALIQEADVFMGSNSGPAVVAIFGVKPYWVFEISKPSFSYSARKWGIPIGSSRLPFAGEHQRIFWGPVSTTQLAECLESACCAARRSSEGSLAKGAT